MMFSAVGPGLLDEAEEKALRRSLNSWHSSFHEEAVVAYDENVLADGEDVQDVEVKLPDETFGNWSYSPGRSPEAASAARERSADSELQESQHADLLAEAEAAKM
jgi:hypothetical protein